AYFDLVDMLLEAGRTEDAFEVADAARGRALAEHLAVAGGQPRALGALAEGDELLRRIDGLSTKIVEYEEYGDVDAVRQLAERLSEARREYELLLINVAERSAPNAELLGMRPADAAAVRLAMSPDEAIVAYLVGRDELLTFVVRREGVSAFTTSATARSLASRVRLVRGLVAQGGRSVEQAYAALTGLHDVLIARLARADALDDVRRLIIVPQGVLTYLPFASLRDRGTGRYLVQDYALLYLPSAGALPVLRGVRGERGGRAGRGGRGGPRVSLDARAQSAAAVFAPLPDDLPATEVEARTVQRILGRARLHVGSAATESRLRESLEGDGIVHVASHGVMNLVSPMFSRVEMVRSGAGKSANDGRLELHEVLGLSIRSPLVFLSGCETGLGAAWSTGFAAGEDYATLARAFLYAGAPNVVATLWRVADRGSGEFAERFYRHLRDVGPVEALARAQRDMLGHSRYGHPYYWAPYLVAGAGALRAAAQETARLSVPQEIPGS
ncbi:MAG: CHAT domain-containing protein, partial [Armatimonadota bacterium]